MKRENKSNTLLFRHADGTPFLMSREQFEDYERQRIAYRDRMLEETKEQRAQWRQRHIKQMSEEFECTAQEYELLETIVDKVYTFCERFTKEVPPLAEDQLTEFMDDLQWNILDALKANRGSAP